MRLVCTQRGQQTLGRHLVVGVVQQDRKVFADRHQLHSALDHTAGQTLMDRLICKPQRLAHTQRRQRIVYAEFARHIYLYVHLVRTGHMELYAQKVMGAQQLVAARSVIGLFSPAVTHQAAGMALQQRLGVGVIAVDNAHRAAAEQLSLPAAVLLKACVLSRADMIRREVCKHADIIVDACHPVHHQTLAGHLHQRSITSCIHKAPEQLLQLIALRGRVGGIFMMAHKVHAVGADHSHLAACGFQHAFDHMGRGGLAFGAGDPDHGQLAGRVAEQICAHQRQRQAAALHLDHRDPRKPGQVNIVLDHQSTDPLCRTVCGKLVAVPLGAHDADKGQPRGGPAAVVDDICNFRIQAALHQCAGQALSQLCKLHFNFMLLTSYQAGGAAGAAASAVGSAAGASDAGASARSAGAASGAGSSSAGTVSGAGSGAAGGGAT